MQTTEMVALDTLAIAARKPVYMLNLLRYHARAVYPAGARFAPCSGREAYHERYRPAFGKLAPEGIEVAFVGAVIERIVGPTDEAWDDVAIVKYPDFATFRTLVESAAYLETADPHRRAALADWRLIAMDKAG